VKRDGSARGCRWTAPVRSNAVAGLIGMIWASQAAGLDLALIGLAAASGWRSPQWWWWWRAVPLPLAVVCLMPVVYGVNLPSPIC
jgi:hypothetical protein